LKKEPENFYDDLQPFDTEAANKYAEDQKALGESLAYLIHRVFKQNEDGAKLLARWTEIVTMTEVVAPGLDLGQIGKREGYNMFVREIIRSINQVEAGDK
jgi:hypothetical protein